MRLGVHVSAAGGLDQVPDRAARLGCDALQLFVTSNRQWAIRPLPDGEARRFVQRRRDGMPAFAHACYLVNPAAADPAVRERSVAALAAELRRCDELGLDGLVVHPGAHGGHGPEAGLERVLRTVERVLRRAGPGPPLLLEATAGQGTALGARLGELSWLLERTDPGRVGLCLDTCHLHAAGYALDSSASVRSTLAHIGERLGWERVALWHLNDSVAPAGSRRDRHAGIGEGTIGRAGFRALLADERVRARPGILETPKGDGDHLDRLNLRRLRALVQRRRWPAAAGGSSADPTPEQR